MYYNKLNNIKEFVDKPFPYSTSDCIADKDGVKTYLWSANDTKESFKDNLKEWGEYLEYWKDRSIEYTINTSGYRCDFNFPDKKVKEKVDVFIGCSITYGVGVTKESTFVDLFSKYTGNKTINLGISGTGIEMSYISLLKIMNSYDVRNVFFFLPVYPRYYFYIGQHPAAHQTFMFNQGWDFYKSYSHRPFTESFFKGSLADGSFMEYTYQRGLDAIYGLCKKKKVKLINWLDYDDFQYMWAETVDKYLFFYNSWPKIRKRVDFIEGSTVARDLIHPGIDAHRLIADSMIKIYKKKFIKTKQLKLWDKSI
jgi:hypothetical protein